jgi:glucosamine kinase
MIEYLIGVDGGGSGTRVRLARARFNPGIDYQEIADGAAGPSALSLGIAPAWQAIDTAVTQAFTNAALEQPAFDKLAIGLGMSGVHNASWAQAFIAANPGYAACALGNDAFSTLIGAHGGKPGAIIALGTGSVGEAMLADGTRREVGGWGFPSGDEGGGAWIGMAAVNYIQQVIDGRLEGGTLADAVIAACGGSRPAIQDWLAGATATRYATLAPLVVQHAEMEDDAALEIMQSAGYEVDLMAAALDPDYALPLCLCGGLGAAIVPYLDPDTVDMLVPAQGDSAAGALRMIAMQLDSTERKQ